MPTFTYDAPQSRYVGTLANLIAQGGDPQARAALVSAAARARAVEQSGFAWAGAAQNITNNVANTIGNIPAQIEHSKENALRSRILQGQAADADTARAGRGAMDKLMRGDTLPAGDVGPRQESYLNADGLFDVPKLTKALGAMGVGAQAPDLLKGAESINDSILKHQALEQQAGQAHTVMIGDLADSALKLAKVGMPLDRAMDFVAQPALATKRLKPEDYAQVKAHILEMPPEQQQQALGALMDAAAKFDKGDTLAKDAKHVDRYGRVDASNIVPPTPSRAQFAAIANDPSKTPEERAAATKSLADMTPAPKRTDTEMALDAFARSLNNGKTKAEELTDAERQAFVKRDADTKASTAFAQHQRERNFDVAHPVPVKGKSQDELEQEARGVLQKEFSARTGGLGTEDSKVNLAVHLRALLDQYDGKPMPAQIHAELAMGLAKLTSPSGTVGIELEKEFKQKTAQEGLAKGIAYLTGDPTLVNATPEKLREMLSDSIQRQGSVAEQNRQTYLDAMLAMLPTQLEQSRRDALSKSVKLNEMPPPKGSPATGTTRDGLTWKRGAKGWGWYR